MTNPKSPRTPKSSTRARPKQAIVCAAEAGPASGPSVYLAPGVAPSPVLGTAVLSTAVLSTAAPSTAAAPAVETSTGIRVQLESSLEIKDAEAVHRLLSAALDGGRAITVDVGRVLSVDTAGAQLLLAFQGEASRRGMTIEFHGESPPLTHTLAALGLSNNFAVAARRG